METKDIKITVTGGNCSGKSSILSMLAVVFSCLQSTKGTPINFIIDPNSQTLKEGGLLTEDQLNISLEKLIEEGKIRLVLKDESESRIVLQ